MASGKPSYLGLLNAISNAETQAASYFDAWAAVTPDEDVRFLVRFVGTREAEHGLTFRKRLMEMGYGLLDRPDPTIADKVAYVGDAAHSDLEKFVYLGYGEGGERLTDDPFGDFFKDLTIDIETGALLGRYIAEERDTVRRMHARYQALKAAAAKPKAAPRRRKAA